VGLLAQEVHEIAGQVARHARDEQEWRDNYLEQP